MVAKAEVLSGDAAQGSRYCRLTYDLGEPKQSRAAYARLDRPMESALRISLMVRGKSSMRPWLRAAVVDGNGTRQTFTLEAALEPGDRWRRVQARLPDGLKAPLKWESVYVVADSGQTGDG